MAGAGATAVMMAGMEAVVKRMEMRSVGTASSCILAADVVGQYTSAR